MKVKYVNQPRKEGGKFGNIKMESGETFFVNVGQLNKYRVGMEIDPTGHFSNEKWGDNVVQVLRATFDPANANAAPAPAAAPSPSHNNPPATYSSNGTKDAAMFVMGVVGRAMGSGNFGATDVKALALAAVEAWNEVKGRL